MLPGVTAFPDGEEFSHLSEASVAISEILDLLGDVEEMGLRTDSMVIFEIPDLLGDVEETDEMH